MLRRGWRNEESTALRTPLTDVEVRVEDPIVAEGVDGGDSRGSVGMGLTLVWRVAWAEVEPEIRAATKGGAL